MQAQKFEFLPSVGYPSHKILSPPVFPLITDHILEKKVSLIEFKQTLPKKIACHVFSATQS